MTTAERRRASRYAVVFPLEVDCGPRKQRLAVCVNASVGGILFASRSAFDVGEEVDLRLLLPGSGPMQRARGRVVRRFQDPGADVFSHRTAVEFVEALPVLEEALAAD